MCAGEIGVVCRWFAMPAVIDELISMTSSKRREAIWPNGLYDREARLRSSHPFSLQVKIPRRMSNSVGESVVENVFSIH